MRQKMLRAAASLCAAALLAAGLAACAPKTETTSGSTQTPAASSSSAAQTAGFAPRLDTEAAVALDAGVFFGNFEAFDQVINAFNEQYPNVTISYEQISGNQMVEYLRNNSNVDILMIDTPNVRYADWNDSYVFDQLADLKAEDVDVSAVQDEWLDVYTVDGKLVGVPMGLKLSGIVVNKTLLEKEGLSVPTNYQEFLDTCEALKNAGYTPIQGPDSAVYGELAYNLAMTQLGNDDALREALNNGEDAAVTAMEQVLDRLGELRDKGYIDAAVNAEYPEDNYDGAILKFFEGEVPFWVCDTEKVSGMKKRESKSEVFSANPFEYQFVYAPMADDGVCQYVEPWFGFAVNNESDDYDYAIEFLRFLAQEDQLNTLASVKGVPSAAKHSTDTRYDAVQNPENVAARFVNDGTILNHMKTYFKQEAVSFGRGETATAEEAARSYVERCAEVAANMAENS